MNDTVFPFEIYSKTGDGALIMPSFSEKYAQIIQVTEGTVLIHIGTEHKEASEGDFLYVSAGMVFSAEAKEGLATVRVISFDISIIASNMLNYENEILYTFYTQAENNIRIFDKKHPAYAIILRCMNESYEEYMEKDVCYKLPIRANIYLMMTSLLRYFCGSKNESDKLVYHNVLRLRPVVNYISEHFCEKLYIERLAEIIMVSADYFTKMFKDSIGKTPVDYINALRINRAMKLLISTSDSMSEIAEKIGFCNANYFHKIFKQYMDVSPLAYRKRAKK